jgi:hypothetical protein
MSCAMIATTGAFLVFSRFPCATQGKSFSLASNDFTKTKRAGHELELVGPHFRSSYNSFSTASLTGLGSQPL